MPGANRRVVVAWVLVVIWVGIILAASGDGLSFSRSSRFLRPVLEWLLPQLTQEEVWRVVGAVRKAAHVAEYWVLAMLVRHAGQVTLLARGWPPNRLKLALFTLGFAITCAACDEIRQSFTVSRNGSVWDVLWDTSGATLGLICVHFFMAWRTRTRPASSGEADSHSAAAKPGGR